MANEVTILLSDYKFNKCALVNQFLIDSGLAGKLRVVLAEYEEDVKLYSVGQHEAVIRQTTKTCLGLEALDEKAHFYYTLKGSEKIKKMLEEYDR